MGAFKAYDIRGVYNVDFDKDTAYKVGFFLPGLLGTKEVVVGRDVRTSSPEIHKYLCMGITDAGADVWDIGMATTPLVYFATAFLNAGGSVQITASHNPKQYNGMKISRAKAIPVGYESGLNELERMVKNEPVKPVEAAKRGKIVEKDIHEDYVKYQKSFLPDLTGLKLAIDCSNGMSSIFVHEIFGDNAVYINDNLDGNFPAHEPNPLEPKNCQQLMDLVKKTKADIGMIYDGDADRFISVDEKGRFIQPDYLTAVIGSWYLEKGKEKILVDIRTSQSSIEYLMRKGAEEVIIWKVGHAYAKTMLRDKNCAVGGELAGHYYFRDFYNCDSGLHASIIMLNVMKSLKDAGRTFSSLIDEIVVYANSGETNFRMEQKDEAVKALHDTYSKQNPTRILDFDGYRIEFPTWWFNVRKSNTEPFLRLIVEARTQQELDQRLAELKAIIGRFN